MSNDIKFYYKIHIYFHLFNGFYNKIVEFKSNMEKQKFKFFIFKLLNLFL